MATELFRDGLAARKCALLVPMSHGPREGLVLQGAAGRGFFRVGTRLRDAPRVGPELAARTVVPVAVTAAQSSSITLECSPCGGLARPGAG